MRHISLSILAIFTSCMLFISCKKNSNDAVHIASQILQIGQPISNSGPVHGAVKGTMLSGKTYTVDSDLIVNAGDTLLIQSGVTVNVSPNVSITVKGTLLSLGSQAAPNWITVPGITKMDNPNTNPSDDPAYQGHWLGINCDTSCKLLVIKWTHVEFAGAEWVNPTLPGLTAGHPSWPVYFENPNGVLVFEDSWVYGCVDDAIHILGGKFSIMRNTVEKAGYQDGDVFDTKNGSVGDMAYNLIIGGATTGTRASNNGVGGPQTNVNMYNNTYVNCGYRQIQTGHGANVDYEQGARGMAYNNLIVNCKFGVRIVGSPAADTANLQYGNTYNYGDSLAQVEQFYPVGYVTHPQSSDIPAPSSYIDLSTYILGAAYTPTQNEVSQNSPLFKDYPLPATQGVANIAYISGYDFHLQSNSPAIGKGYTAFSPLGVVPVDPNFGATAITNPGADIGCYQSNGTGNQH